jgi:hypothetical protein
MVSTTTSISSPTFALPALSAPFTLMGGSKINREGREEREEKNGAEIIHFIIH